MKDPDPKRSPYAFRTMKLTATNVRINAGIRDEDMAVKMPEGSIIVDTIAGKTFRVGGDAMFDRDLQKILKDLDSKESRRRLCDRGLGGTCACMTRTSSLGSLNSQDASVFWGSFYL
jgi:GTPase involved in cell partitioning and DNA repair